MLQVYENGNKINYLMSSISATFVDMFIEFANNLSFEEIYSEAFPRHLHEDEENCKKNNTIT
ncbi:hypothetical protein [Paenibacillus xylanexedens]|jgi:hypothetical protein|uniref:hypothetical protein n=1 Tax=Paenibacillus xylanexedens TaxID=528191 RepID=UPI00119E30E3|nr:hypothetical protein [Paenibacillus xylanexedens]